MESRPLLKRVIRLDSTPLNRAFFTEEGYLIDTPILTSTGIFEYVNPDGSVRRELRLPEEVFSEKSLASYESKPVIITHDAGLVTKDNVLDNEVGTILTKGFRDGDNVRAKIVIHGTDEMKESGLKELSLGYNLDLDETPGIYNGQKYDAIQRNIMINHLALVREARAGEKARLNIDSRDAATKGVKIMSYKKRTKTRRADGILSPEELQKAIEEYKARHPQTEKSDDDEPEKDDFPVKEAEGDNPEDAAEEIRKKQGMKEDDEEKKDLTEANETIAHQDEDIQTLLDIIDTLLAERDFKAEQKTDCDEPKTDGEDEECQNEDEDDAEEEAEEPAEVETVQPEENEDEDDEEEAYEEDEDEDDDDDEFVEDEDDDVVPTKEKSDIKPSEMNTDSVDALIRTRVKIGIAASKLNMDGLENVSIKSAKKAIIRAVRPTMNLDGKGDAYINAAFDCACEDINRAARKDTRYQKKQMFNKDSKTVTRTSSAESARQRMIRRLQEKREKGGK